MVAIHENINRENFNPGIPGVCEWDHTITSEKWEGPGCGRYHENVNRENPKTANPREFCPAKISSYTVLVLNSIGSLYCTCTLR